MDSTPNSTTTAPHICILGGGFGGLYTALRLQSLPWTGEQAATITLVDPRDRFVFAPLLYELITDELQTWEVAPPYTELLAQTSVRFIQQTVAGVDLAQQQVTLASGDTLTYDRLVLATGSDTPALPGTVTDALPFRTLEDAQRLRDSLRTLETSDRETLRIAIIGGGYSGVELACKLADRLGRRGRIRIVERGAEILAQSPEFNRQAAQRALGQRGVWVDMETTVAAATGDRLTLEYRGQRDEIPVDLVLWAVGATMAPWVTALGLPLGDRGRIQVQSTLQVVDHPHLFALGDIADCKDAEGQQVPPTAQAALQQADYTAWNLWASLTHRPLLPFRYQHLGEMMALGIDNATLSGLGLQLDGPLAHVARRLTYLYRMPTLSHQIRVGLHWMQQPLRDWLSVGSP